MISVCVVEPETSGNLGAIARVMKNFGIRKLFLLNPKCEVLCGESRARSMHAYNILENAKIVKSFPKSDYLVATSAKLGVGNALLRVPITPSDFAKNIDLKKHYCIVLGRESHGLYNNELKQCDVLVHIPANKSYLTLNISHALAIILYELFGATIYSKVANRKQREAVLMLARKALGNVENRENYLEVLENVMSRSFIREKEARALAGLFSKMK